MQCVYDMHKEQQQGTEDVYFGKKKPNHDNFESFGFSYPSD